MKTKILSLLLLIVSLVLSGCIPSVHPLYNEDDLVFNEEILGEWVEAGSEVKWVFEAASYNSYVLRITEDRKLSNIELHIVKLGDNFFFDFYPGDNDHIKDMNGYLSLQFIPVHTFAKVNITPEYIEVYRLDPSWLEEILDNDPSQIKHEKTSEYILLTASTDDLQRFIIAYAELEEMYLEKEVLYRK
jgi:hypothetical protein